MNKHPPPPNGQSYSSEAFRCWVWVVIFAMAFAWVESSVVAYLRKIYFPGGFTFPIVVNWINGQYVRDPLMHIELGREVATIIMLIAIGWASGKNALQRFCFFTIAFGVWDIFFYIWLKVMLNWPESLMTWDLLFLLPFTWTGPVITPILIAMAMIVAGSVIIFYDEKGVRIHIRWYDGVIVMFCGLLMIIAFCWDWKNIMRIPDGVIRSGIPNPFAWWLYSPAYILSVGYVAVRLIKMVSSPKHTSPPPEE